MKKLITVILFCSLLLMGCESEPIQSASTVADSPVAESLDEQSEHTNLVTRVVDGDTIIVDIDGVEERVRLIGVDTPESVHPDADRNVEYGKIASDFTKSQLEGKDVTLEYDVQERDQYGRILAYVYLGGKMFNKTLLEEGHAKVATYPPNVKYVDDFKSIQEQARENGRGVWAFDVLEAKPSEAVSTSGSPDNGSQGSSAVQAEESFVGNSNTMKFHRSGCKYVDDIADHNVVFLQSRDDAINRGYVGCKVCNP